MRDKFMVRVGLEPESFCTVHVRKRRCKQLSYALAQIVGLLSNIRARIKIQNHCRDEIAIFWYWSLQLEISKYFNDNIKLCWPEIFIIAQ